MLHIKQTKKLISTAMAIMLAGGLLLTPVVEKVTAQGGVLNSKQETVVAISKTDLADEKQYLPSTIEKNVEQESTTTALEEPTLLQENNSILPSTENNKENKPLVLQEQLIPVTDSVYSQANESRRTTLNVLAAAEQLRKKKQQLPSADTIREIPEKRTLNSKHYLMKDGSYQAVISMGQEHYEDEDGELQDIIPFVIDETNLDLFNGSMSKEKALSKNNNNHLEKKKKDYYTAPMVPFDLKLYKSLADGYSISKNAESIHFKPVGTSNVTGTVYGNSSIIYNNAWRDTDVLLEVEDTGLKETLILKSEYAPTQFSYEVTGMDHKNFITDQFYLLPAWLIDNNGVTRDLDSSFREENGELYIDYKFDPKGLSYPIAIDPSVLTKTASEDTYIQKTSGGSSSVGQSNGYGSPLFVGFNSSREVEYTPYIKFDLSDIPQNSIVTEANMNATGICNTCKVPIDLYKVLEYWTERSQWDLTIKIEDQIKTAVSTFKGYTEYVEGTWEWNIKSLVQNWVNHTWENYGVALKSISSDQGDIVKIYSKEYTFNKDRRPSLTIKYNVPPLAQSTKVISPNGGEVIDQGYTLLWQAAIDPDDTQSTLKYQIELSTNSGSNWSTICNTTQAGATSYYYDFSNIASTTKALIRVRAFDGVSYTDWDQSDAPFTIQHNLAPNAPSGLAPGSTSSTAPTFVAGVTPTLNWTFSDPDAGDTQSAYQVLLYNTSNGLVYDSGWVTSSAKSFTVPTNKLVRGTAYFWKVLVKDSKGAASPASNAMYIKCNTIPTLNLTSYANNTSVPDNVLTFTWTFTDGDGQAQSAVQIQGSKDNFATIAYNSGTINGSATTFTTPPLANGTWSFRVMGSDGVEWSAYSQRTGLSLPNTFEPNDSTATATPASYGTYTTLINSATDVDFFKYTASTAGVNRVQLTPPAGKNYDVYVYDSSNTLLAAGVRSTGVSENIICEVTAGSTYYVKVVGASGEYSTTDTYSLTISNVNFKTQTTYDYDSNGNLKTKTTTVVP